LIEKVQLKYRRLNLISLGYFIGAVRYDRYDSHSALLQQVLMTTITMHRQVN